MTLTPLEACLGGGLVALIVGLGVHWFTKANYVSCKDCAERHQLVDIEMKDGKRRDSKLFTMVKALVIYTDKIPDDEKAKLLSERTE